MGREGCEERRRGKQERARERVCLWGEEKECAPRDWFITVIIFTNFSTVIFFWMGTAQEDGYLWKPF